MRGGPTYVVCAALCALASPVTAVTLAECTRTTHISHGGEADHLDLGEGRVMWRDWWSQEGTAETLVVVECGSGDALFLRTAEENMTGRAPFDRTEEVRDILDRAHAGARVFATLPRLASAVDKLAKDIDLRALQREPCACAAVYAELLGEKIPFQLESPRP
ncbi:MAG: hypothetical protein AAF943_15110 [Pseudomonadota bacterium]